MNDYGKARKASLILKDKYLNMRDFLPTCDKMMLVNENNGKYFGKRMYKDGPKLPSMVSNLDLTMPQSKAKVDVDHQNVKRGEIKNRKNTIGGKDGEKINNIIREMHSAADCFFDQN